MGPKTPQQSTQSQKHQEQRQITSYDQWTQHTEQTKQQSRRQHIRLLDADYRTMTIETAPYTPQQQTSTKSVWTTNKEIATGNVILNKSTQYDSIYKNPTRLKVRSQMGSLTTKTSTFLLNAITLPNTKRLKVTNLRIPLTRQTRKTPPTTTTQNRVGRRQR